jgi:hypothetical protein
MINLDDSYSNNDSDNFHEDLDEIEDEKGKKKDKEKTPIPQSLLFTIFGIISCFLSYIETSLITNLLFSYKNKNFEKSKLFLEDIKYIVLFIISLIILRFRLKKPKLFQIILSLLYCYISYSSTYIFSRNIQSFTLLSKGICFILISLLFGIKNIKQIRISHNYKFPLKVWIGLLLALLGLLIELISSYFLTNLKGEDNIRFIFHYNDYHNYLISLSYGICYAIIFFIFDFYCNEINIIFDTLFYIGFFSSIICFVLSLCYSEIMIIRSTFHEFGAIQVNYYILYIALFLFNIILQSILIKRCSIYSIGIIFSSQISFRVIVDLIKYQYNFNSNIITTITVILCFAGLFTVCLHYISKHYNEKIPRRESLQSIKSTDNRESFRK